MGVDIGYWIFSVVCDQFHIAPQNLYDTLCHGVFSFEMGLLVLNLELVLDVSLRLSLCDG